MKKLTTVLLASGMALASTTALARDFSFTYVQGDIGEFESDVSDGDNFGIEGSYQFPSGLLIGGHYREDEYDEPRRFDFELQSFGINVGAAQQLNRNTAGWFRVGYADLESDSNASALDGLNGDVYSVKGGVRTWLTQDTIEGFLIGGLERYELEDDDDSGPMLGGGIRFHLTPQFTLGGSVDRRFALEDRDTITIEARLQF